MEFTDTLLFVFFFTLCILFGGLLAALELLKKRRKEEKKPPVRRLSILKRIHRRYLLKFRSRPAMEREIWWNFVNGDEEIEVLFYVPRKPAQVSFSVKGSSGFHVDQYRYQSGEEWITEPFGVRYLESKGYSVARIYPSRIALTKKIRFRAVGLEDGRSCLVQSRLIKEPYPDLEQWDLAVELYDKKEYQQALAHLKECSRYTDESPGSMKDCPPYMLCWACKRKQKSTPSICPWLDSPKKVWTDTGRSSFLILGLT